MVSNLIDKDGRQSKGVLLLRTLAMPSDTNANGDIFGGWIMSQMDMGGAILAKEIAHGRVVTVAVESMNFIKPIAVGDVVCCYGQCLSVGRSSIKIKSRSMGEKSCERTNWGTLLRDRGRIYLCGCWERWQSSRGFLAKAILN